MFEKILRNLEESQKVPMKEFKGQRKWLVERPSKIFIYSLYGGKKLNKERKKKAKQNERKTKKCFINIWAPFFEGIGMGF